MSEYGGYDRAAWQRVADVLKRQRVELGFPIRSTLVSYLVQHQLAKMSIDRILGDLERGARDNYASSTIASVETWYGLVPGEIRRILKNESDLTRQAKALKRAAKAASKGETVEMNRRLHSDGWELAGLADLPTADLAGILARIAEELESRTRVT